MARALLSVSLPLSLALLSACAPAVPLLGAASTTPVRRGDIVLGGSARVGFGGLDPEDPASPAAAVIRDAAPSGVAPVAAGRYGIAEHTDLGLTAVGPLGQLDVRHEIVIPYDAARVVLLFGGAVFGGYVDGEADGAEGARVGGEIPVVLGIDAVSLVELWIGARIGLEHDWGSLGAVGATESASLTGFRAGGVLGLAFGFRHVHAMLELTAYYERWSGEAAGSSLTTDGLVLVPGFALRGRI